MIPFLRKSFDAENDLFLIAGEPQGLRFIAGIFVEKATARAYLDGIVEAERAAFWLIEASQIEFPFYLVEASNDFIVLSPREAREYLAHVAANLRVRDDEHVYFTLYRIETELEPEEAGADEMRALWHIHVENRDLDRIAESGFDWFWAPSATPSLRPPGPPSIIS